jgi:hypothetical protein
MKIDGLSGINQVKFVAYLKRMLCTKLNNLDMPIWAQGFDTLRFGLQRIKNVEAQAKFMRKLADSTGSELFILKYLDNQSLDYEWNEIPEDVKDSYTKIYKRPISTISSQFYRYRNIYILRYKETILWILDHQKAKNLTLELYGLSQPHHSKGAVKWEFLSKMMKYLSSYQKPVLLGYDYAVDFQMPFDWIVDNIAFPLVASQIDKARGKQKPDLYYYNNDKNSGTVYLQAQSKVNRGNKVTIYNKQKKHNLEFPLVRIEFRKECNLNFKDIKILNMIAKQELKELCLIPDRVEIEKVCIDVNS